MDKLKPPSTSALSERSRGCFGHYGSEGSSHMPQSCSSRDHDMICRPDPSGLQTTFDHGGTQSSRGTEFKRLNVERSELGVTLPPGASSPSVCPSVRLSVCLSNLIEGARPFGVSVPAGRKVKPKDRAVGEIKYVKV